MRVVTFDPSAPSFRVLADDYVKAETRWMLRSPRAARHYIQTEQLAV